MRRRKNKKAKSPEYIIGLTVYALLLFAFASAGLLHGPAATFTVVVGTIYLFFGDKIFTTLKNNAKKKQYLKSDIYAIDSMSGEAFEEYLKAHLEERGYKVSLTPKSGDYGVDLICKKDKEKIAIQAKRYSNHYVGVDAVQQVMAGKVYYKCDRAIVITNSRYTNNAYELAKNDDVELWDRDRLKKEFLS